MTTTKKMKQATCPFTLAPFEVSKTKSGFYFKNPTTKRDIFIKKDGDYYLVHKDLFKFKEIMTTNEARAELNVSRQRILQLENAGKLNSFMIKNRKYFLKDEVIKHKMTRKTGRPRLDEYRN